MTGSRELTALQQFRALAGASPAELQTHALVSIATSLAAIADLYEYELACLDAPEEAEEAGEEARPS